MVLKRYINECVGCPPERGCLGTSCPKRRRIIYICDRCGAELDEDRRRGYEFELCSACEAYRNGSKIYAPGHKSSVKRRIESRYFVSDETGKARRNNLGKRCHVSRF